jgi:prolyl-tRNA synthetase
MYNYKINNTGYQMRQSELFQKTSKDVNKTDVSKNAQLLTQGGFVNQLMAGVYSYLPLGLRVLNNIENIIRQEMNSVGGQEILMPALQPKEIWEQTGRWDKMDILFKLKGAGDRDLALGPTHEEVVTPLAASLIKSYKDLPVAVYQVQTKFRNEARAKSGLLRGREFRMKDMYSFHTDQKDLDSYYEEVVGAYTRIYERCGLGKITKMTFASGGVFSKYSHEFQTVTESGEDVIYFVPGTNQAINKEIIDDRDALKDIVPNYKDGDEKDFVQAKAIEVGNIFKLGTKFTEACNARYADKDGALKFPVMGCYGIGPSRVMGTIAECLSDDKGLVWPDEVAPFQVHLVSFVRDENEIQKCDELYNLLKNNGIQVLYDDRQGVSPGNKLADSDLLGIPNRLVLSKKTLEQNAVEFKRRDGNEMNFLQLDKVVSHFKP